MAKLSKDEIVTLHVLKEKGESNCAIADRLGVTEGAVRLPHLPFRWMNQDVSLPVVDSPAYPI